MTQHTVNHEKIMTIPSKELRALRKEIRQLQIDWLELCKEKNLVEKLAA